MSPVATTAEQARAIMERNVSVALSAGAGCGKTFVLTERFLAELDPLASGAAKPAELSELVAITFTERAAREMRDRIRQKCYERLTSATGAAAEYWLAMLRAIDRARVNTIHGFCGALLRSHAVEARVDPQFAILEESHSATLGAELIDDLLRDKLAAQDELTLQLITEFGLERVRGCLLNVLANREELDLPHWLAATAEEQVAVWQEFHRRFVLPVLLEEISDSGDARATLAILREVGFDHPVMLERQSTLLDLLPKLSSSKNPAEDLARLREASMLTGGVGKNIWPDPETYEAYSAAVKNLRALIDKAQESIDFDAAAALPAAEAGLKLLQLASFAVARYEQSKADLGLLDFQDLLSKAHRLLTDPANKSLRRRIAAQIRLLLVDEFQDTDPLQVELVKALCDGDFTSGRLFFVGDFKQSIYRFRGADPQVFRALQDETPAAGRLPLTQNFRSQPAILDFVNALFQPAFGAGYEPLRPARQQVSPTPAVELMWVPVEGSKRERGTTDRLRGEEAEWIARRIRTLLDEGKPVVYDAVAAKQGQPTARPAQLGDIAILFRALTSVARYEEALRAYGIEYYLVGGHAFYAQQEIFDLVNLLRTLVSPLDEISLLGVLRSPLFALDDETIFWLARHPSGLAQGLYAKKLPAQLSSGQQARASAAAHILSDLRRMKDRLPIAELIQTAFARTGYDAALLTEFLGERKLANLRKLIDEARGFDQSGVFALSDFIVQLSQFVVEQPREALAATHAESTNVVRLMTIHQSKGLEFPIVFLPDVDRSTHGVGAGFELHAELGPLIRPDSESPLCGYDLAQLVSRREERNELTRLFYVACTRAADRLILSGSPENLDRPRSPWMKLLADQFELTTGELRGPLPVGFAKPEVHVTLEPPVTTAKRSGRQKGVQLERQLEEADQLLKTGKLTPDPAVGSIPSDVTARRHYSFSSLTGALQRATEEMPSQLLTETEEESGFVTASPAPAKEDGIDPRRLGTLVHAVLAQLVSSPTGSSSGVDVSTLLQRASSRQLVVEPRELALAEEMVRRFQASARAADMQAAKQRHAELEFMLAWPPESAVSGGVYLQGFIDCLYQQPGGGWRILDYKTNLVDAAGVPNVASQYELQLYVYALAAEQMLGEPPQELTLYFLRPDVEFSYPWNDQARKRVRTLLQQAIK